MQFACSHHSISVISRIQFPCTCHQTPPTFLSPHTVSVIRSGYNKREKTGRGLDSGQLGNRQADRAGKEAMPPSARHYCPFGEGKKDRELRGVR
jgi:hypothetical protein